MSLGRWTNEPAPALKVVSPTMTSSSPSSTQKASSSRWWMWGGGPPPGGTTESVSEYAPPVSSPDALKVISSSATQSISPSPSVTCRALGWFASMPFLSSTNTLSSMLAARHKLARALIEVAEELPPALADDSIHRAAEKVCSRKPIFNSANRYAFGPEQRIIVRPKRRGEPHNM